MKAKEHIRRAANLAQRLGDDEAMPVVLCNLASVEDHSGKCINKNFAQIRSKVISVCILLNADYYQKSPILPRD